MIKYATGKFKPIGQPHDKYLLNESQENVW